LTTIHIVLLKNKICERKIKCEILFFKKKFVLYNICDR
jgi:hypothetical protein